MVALSQNRYIQYALRTAANSSADEDFGMLMLWIFIIFLCAFAIAGLAILLFYQPWKKSEPPKRKEVVMPPQPIGAAQQQIYNISTSGYAAVAQTQAIPPPVSAPTPEPLATQQVAMPPSPAPAHSGSPRVPYLGMVPAPASQSYTLSPSLPAPPAKPTTRFKQDPDDKLTAVPAPQSKSKTPELAEPEDEKPEGLQEKDGRYVESFPRYSGLAKKDSD